MVNTASVSWGSYLQYEGPVYWGKEKFTRAQVDGESGRILYVITTTEGGAFDAYNGYDKCICTSGLIQWCDRAPWFLVTKLLGAVATEDVALVAPVVEFCSAHGYTFGKTAQGQWRFWNEAGIVETTAQQQELYLGGSSGLRGQWTDIQREHAKEWAAACSSVWEQLPAQRVQVAYTVNRLLGFATPAAKIVLLKALEVGSSLSMAFRAAYLSFAANNPKKASDALGRAVDDIGIRWTEEWLIDVLHHLTFDPGIAIYPHRYDMIRPVIEELYGIDLPDFSGALSAWMKQHNFGGQLEPRELQRALQELGYDIGPAGVDGIFGERTRQALRAFEQDVLVPTAYCDGYPDQYTIPRLETALKLKGHKLHWKEPKST
jgi:hypothetical protein